jgi:hypothetical protein
MIRPLKVIANALGAGFHRIAVLGYRGTVDVGEVGGNIQAGPTRLCDLSRPSTAGVGLS